jgi:hypothetical protein
MDSSVGLIILYETVSRIVETPEPRTAVFFAGLVVLERHQFSITELL